MSKLIRGVISKGVIKPLEELPYPDGTEVMIKVELSKDIESIDYFWRNIKETIAKKYPELLNMTKEEASEEFDRFSEKIAKNSRFETWEEMEKFMRSDYYDLTRY